MVHKKRFVTRTIISDFFPISREDCKRILFKYMHETDRAAIDDTLV